MQNLYLVKNRTLRVQIYATGGLAAIAKASALYGLHGGSAKPLQPTQGAA